MEWELYQTQSRLLDLISTIVNSFEAPSDGVILGRLTKHLNYHILPKIRVEEADERWMDFMITLECISDIINCSENITHIYSYFTKIIPSIRKGTFADLARAR